MNASEFLALVDVSAAPPDGVYPTLDEWSAAIKEVNAPRQSFQQNALAQAYAMSAAQMEFWQDSSRGRWTTFNERAR